MEMWNDYKIDSRNKNDLLREIETLAKSYTPEWKFDSVNPDPGSVIALIFANQTAESIKKLNQLFGKYQIEFANMYGISLKSAKPAASVVVLSLNESLPTGVSLKKGTQVIGENEQGEEIIFSFLNDLYVTHAKITDILGIAGERQLVIPYRGSFKKMDLEIGTLVPAQSEEAPEVEDIPLFAYRGENINTQALLLSHRFLFSVERICLRFHGNKTPSEFAQMFANRERFTFFYHTEEGIRPFEEIATQGDTIVLIRRQDEKRQLLQGEETSVVILQQNLPIEENIEIVQIEILTGNQEETPDFIWNGRREITEKQFAPFTEQYSLYQEFYIGQKSMLAQGGAVMQLQFELEFEEFLRKEPEYIDEALKIIKRKPKEKYQMAHYECWIQEIAFEYFNGRGWRRLPCNCDMTALFSKEENAGVHQISFEIPSDWIATTQGGYEGKCLRMQILRADNCYMQGVEYHYPVLSEMQIKLQYQKDGVRPDRVQRVHGVNLTEMTTELAAGIPQVVFSKSEYAGDYMFLGFNQKAGEGPISFFMDLQENLCQQGVQLQYCYSTRNGFKPLKVIDRTQNLQNSGTILFIPPSDMAELELEGVKRYWIRVEDMGHYFIQKKIRNPILKNIYMNAVSILNIERKEEQDYYLETVKANMSFPLYTDNILSAEVWVNEREQLSAAEMEKLLHEQTQNVRVEHNVLGEIEDFFVLWHEIEDFDTAGEQERCYCIDRCKNQIIFGDGITVKIPQNTKSIAFKVQVSCCDGERANVGANTIEKFRGPVFSIEGITNPLKAYGGSAMEDMKNALLRGSNILSSRRRFVSERDYVREACLFSDTIDKAACVTGKNKNGKKDPAIISLVLLMKDYAKGSYVFLNLQGELKKHLMQHCEMTCLEEHIEIVEPIFVNISLTIWLTVSDITKSIEEKQRWLDTILSYFEPVDGEKKSNWEIGKLPREKQIRLMLSTLEQKSRIEQYNIYASYMDGDGVHEIGLDQIVDNPFMICCNGTHQIYIRET